MTVEEMKQFLAEVNAQFDNGVLSTFRHTIRRIVKHTSKEYQEYAIEKAIKADFPGMKQWEINRYLIKCLLLSLDELTDINRDKCTQSINSKAIVK